MFTLSLEPLEAEALKAKVINPQSGGFVAFEGWVRNHNQKKEVTELHYEAHEKLAVQVGNAIMQDAMNKFDINLAYCCHRVGRLAIGDMAIWVGVSSDHRKAAFAACEYILNQTKAKVPIWKNEFYQNGESGWVEANL
ncbi:molybdenum cofactor biosynthesis protein MoaE [Marinicella litoralis]|uniref:Molybdopterin synthase catalytic subunit n=1 Tax=Marinicella litoralis TaxID=644220 RepID=A0A4R6XK75_9GAMM|nr:molybdenum cofactor biosynthesis protein MoaE [Marinicella litoralis]TDR18370.1 molybdopterin synthase subunit MoaE [Marinicella litoralis]